MMACLPGERVAGPVTKAELECDTVNACGFVDTDRWSVMCP